MRASLLLLLTDTLIWTSLWYASCEDDEFTSGRTFVLNPMRLSWDDAAVACREMGGELAKIRKFSTIPTLELEGDWTFWVGLTKNEESKWMWMDSTEASWTNWRTDYLSEEIYADFPCSVAVTMLPYWWDPRNCSSTLPSLCELQEGNCTFVRFNHSSIISNNMRFESQMSPEECRVICEEERSFVCRSFEYNNLRQYCQLSNLDRYMTSITFTQNDPELDYYHRTCDFGRLRDGYTVSPIGIITDETNTPAIPTTTDPTPAGLFCTVLKSIDPNVTEPVPEEVKELKSMNVVFKQRAVTLKRISVPDHRPSANYVGSTAVIIAFSLVGSVVICDLASLLRHIYMMHRRFRKRHHKRHKKYDIGSPGELKITAHMNAVTRHMQHISQTSVDKSTPEANGGLSNGDLSNAEVLSEHSFSRINDAYVTDDGDIIGGNTSRDLSPRTYDWSDEDDHTREILEVQIDLTDNEESKNEDDLNKSTNSTTKFIYRTYESTNL